MNREGESTRRQFLATTAAASASLAWPLPRLGAGPAEGDWPRFRRNPRHTGVADGPPAGLDVLWTVDTGDLGTESSAAIVGDTVYVGAVSGQILALDLEAGAKRWVYETGSEIGESSPCVHDGVVYIGDLDGVVHAVRAKDGSKAWTFETRSEIRASPVIHEGRVLIGSYDQFLYALDAKTGARVWSFETEGPVHATCAVADGLTYVAGCDGELRAIAVEDGTQAFSISSGGYTGASPALEGQRAYYGTFENEVLGVDLETRRILWRYMHEDRQFPYYSSAALADGKVVLGGRDKMVHALEMATGKELWTFATRARIDSSPAIAGGRVYVGGRRAAVRPRPHHRRAS